MTHATATVRNKSHRLLLSALLLLTLAVVAGYFYYTLTHYTIDIFGIPNPAQSLHQQKPITGNTPKSLPTL